MQATTGRTPRGRPRGAADYRTSIARSRRVCTRDARGVPQLPGAAPFGEPVEVCVDDRHDNEREQRRGHHSTDDRAAHRSLRFPALAEAHGKRQHDANVAVGSGDCLGVQSVCDLAQA